jgi:MFS family permease
MVDWLGEAKLSRLGVVLLAVGLAATGLAPGYPLLGVGFTLMPIGTAFLFPCVTGLLSTVVASNERGLYMGVQHTFGGVSRVIFPIGAGYLMDHAGVGVPFWLSALLVLVTLPLISGLASFVPDHGRTTDPGVASVTGEITGEIPVTPRAATPSSRD